MKTIWQRRVSFIGKCNHEVQSWQVNRKRASNQWNFSKLFFMLHLTYDSFFFKNSIT